MTTGGRLVRFESPGSLFTVLIAPEAVCSIESADEGCSSVSISGRGTPVYVKGTPEEVAAWLGFVLDDKGDGGEVMVDEDAPPRDVRAGQLWTSGRSDDHSTAEVTAVGTDECVFYTVHNACHLDDFRKRYPDLFAESVSELEAEGMTAPTPSPTIRPGQVWRDDVAGVDAEVVFAAGPGLIAYRGSDGTYGLNWSEHSFRSKFPRLVRDAPGDGGGSDQPHGAGGHPYGFVANRLRDALEEIRLNAAFPTGTDRMSLAAKLARIERVAAGALEAGDGEDPS